jgi:hypothetical protein
MVRDRVFGPMFDDYTEDTWHVIGYGKASPAPEQSSINPIWGSSTPKTVQNDFFEKKIQHQN